MRSYLLLSLLLFTTVNCIAQQTVEVKEKIYSGITARYHVLADSQQVKHGLYQAMAGKKTAIASGKYNNGKKTGVWHYYNLQGKPVQQFNYDTNTLNYEAPEDSTSAIRYILDNIFTEKDTIRKPIKPGGVVYGYLPYLNYFALPNDLYQGNTQTFYAVLEMLVSPGGRLADFKIRVVSSLYNYRKVANINLDNMTEEEKAFIPATLNGKPVSSTVVITCRINNNGKLEFN